MAWAKRIDSIEELPEVYKEYFESHRSKDRSFPYTVLVPGFEILGHPITEKISSVFDGEIHILERRGNSFSVQCFPLKEIRYVEMRTILLDSHIKIVGTTGSGVPASAVIQFNSVTDYLFAPILNKIRQGEAVTMDSVQGSVADAFDPWGSANFKFMNYARRSVLGGEKVIQAILQPEIRTTGLTFLGKTFSRMVSPTHAIILTDRELIAIKEEAVQGRKDKYGGTWVYIPLNKITAPTLNTVDNNLLVFSVQLPEKERFEYLFQASMQAEVSQLLDRLGELISV